MTDIVNIYCDESCHLEHDSQVAMSLGALICDKSRTKEYNGAIARLKKKHNLSKFFEIKWNKVSNSKLIFYLELINFFFDEDVRFRGWIVPDKTMLSHDKHQQSHDDWYYKMYFYLLRNIISINHNYHIYLDIKDTKSRYKVRRLREILSNAKYDFQRSIVEKIQHIHSHDVGLLQLADLLVGALSYHHRGLKTSSAKNAIVELIKKRSGFSLEKNTLPSEKKFNICVWQMHGEDF
ncbi:MAG: DUF3800 domain-containing protein [Gammaproteobacteria bacterium]|nr:DUF3800 domain-containing protein [Gammaproteobacteria bacterium]